MKTCEKVLCAWQTALEQDVWFAHLSACQLWQLCTGPAWLTTDVCDRLSFFLNLQNLAVHLNGILEKIAKYTYSAHRFERVSKALLTLYLRHYPPPQGHLSLQSGILTLPELQRRADRFLLIY